METNSPARDAPTSAMDWNTRAAAATDRALLVMDQLRAAQRRLDQARGHLDALLAVQAAPADIETASGQVRALAQLVPAIRQRLKDVLQLAPKPDSSMLLNLDKPLKRATLHNPFCSLVPKPIGTRLKPLGLLGQHGGWFEVGSAAEAHVKASSLLPDAMLTRCPRC